MGLVTHKPSLGTRGLPLGEGLVELALGPVQLELNRNGGEFLDLEHCWA